jgi:Domain of unknown function (DUF397)
VAQPDPPELTWRKSSSSDDSNCVEVALTPEWVLVRHSQDPPGGILRFSYPEWRAFLAKIRDNELDVNMLDAPPGDC